MPTKKVKIHYRRFYRTSEPPFEETFGSVIHSALNQVVDQVPLFQDVGNRAYEDSDGSVVILNGLLLTSSKAVFGELVRYHPDSNIPLLMQGQGKLAELEIREANKPNNAEFLRGMIFFLIRDDHVLTIEQDLATAAIERYARWLIATRTSTAKDARLQLIPQILVGDTTPLKKVKSIRLAPPQTRAAALEFQKTESVTSDAQEARTDILQILKAAHFDTAMIERIAEEQNASVKIQLDVTFRSGRSAVSVEGQDVLALLRNVDEDDLIINGEGARNNRGVLERLSVDDYIERRGNVLDRRDAWGALEKAVAKYRDAGLIG